MFYPIRTNQPVIDLIISSWAASSCHSIADIITVKNVTKHSYVDPVDLEIKASN